MRRFAPSVLAFLGGLAWLLVSTALIPASDDDDVLPIAESMALDGGPCAQATMLAQLDDVHEASGLAPSRRTPEVLWTHNDSGEPLLYAVGTDGRLRGRIRVSGAAVEDWEDVAVGTCPEGSCVFIGDIGDNGEERTSITIYRVPEPAPDAQSTDPAIALRLAYPDGRHDAEGLFVGPDGALFVITKGEGSPVSIYRVPSTASTSVARLERVATLSGKAQKDERITDADATPDGQWIVLRTLESVEFHRPSSLLAGKLDGGVQVQVKKVGEPQGEGVAILTDGRVFLAGEGGGQKRGGTLALLSCKLP
jgi:hypothetical protein